MLVSRVISFGPTKPQRPPFRVAATTGPFYLHPGSTERSSYVEHSATGTRADGAPAGGKAIVALRSRPAAEVIVRVANAVREHTGPEDDVMFLAFKDLRALVEGLVDAHGHGIILDTLG